MRRFGVAGALLIVVGLLVGGYFAGRVQGQAVHAWPVLRVEYVPHPRDIVNLVEGVPYTVPAGKVLVIRDWTATSNNSNTDVLVNGALVWRSIGLLTGNLATGVVALAGDVVSLSNTGGTVHASGYLADL